MWRWLPLAALAACGRLDFDAATRDVPLPALIQVGTLLTTPADMPVLTIVPTRAGDLVVVATVDIDGGPPIVSIADDASNSYVSANVGYTSSTCTGEVWYATDVAANAMQLTLVDSSPVRREIWLLELANVNALVATAATSNGIADGSTAALPQVMPAKVPAIMMSTMNSGAVESIDPSFVRLPPLNADDAAIAIALVPGSYGPTWTVGNTDAEFAGATVAFAAR